MSILARRACWLSYSVRENGVIQTIRIVNYLAVRRNMVKKHHLKELSELDCFL
jgi:hypothetical protein